MADLVVATFNVRNGRAPDGCHVWPLRRAATAAMVRRLDADIVGLQEAFAFQVQALLRRAPGYRAFGEGRQGGRAGEACPVFVRSSRIETLTAETRWYGGRRGGRLAGASHPRIATRLRCREVFSGLEFELVNTHLDEHRGENRRVAMEELGSWLDPGVPTVLMGDLNTTDDDPLIIEVLGGLGLRLVPPSPALGTAHDFTGRTDGRRIDHVLVSAQFEVCAAEVVVSGGRPFPSDHWPLRVALRLHP